MELLNPYDVLRINAGDCNTMYAIYKKHLFDKKKITELDLITGWKYLKYAAELCHPLALAIIKFYYENNFYKEYINITKEDYIRYLKMLIVSMRIYDYSKDTAEDIKLYEQSTWEGYATLGRLYIMDPDLNGKYLGYAMSVRGANVGKKTESYYALAKYYYDSQNYSEFKTNLYRAAQNKESIWGKEAQKWLDTL
jgi:hypothetical protein